MPAAGCNYKYNPGTNHSKSTLNIMPGLALTLDKVVREVRLKLSTLLSVSVSSYNRQLFSVSSYNRHLVSVRAYRRQIRELSETSYERQIGDLTGDLTYRSSPKDDLNYLPYFYLMHPLHVTKFRQLFQSYLTGSLEQLKEAITGLDQSFTKVHETFRIINTDAQALHESVSNIQRDLLPLVTNKLGEIIDKIKDKFKSINQQSIDKVQKEKQKNVAKIDTTVKSVDSTLSSVICALRNHIDDKLSGFKQTLQGKKEQLKGNVNKLKSFTKSSVGHKGVSSPESKNGGKPDYYKIRDELYDVRTSFGRLIHFLNIYWDDIKKDKMTDRTGKYKSEIDDKIYKSLRKIVGEREHKPEEGNQSLDVYSEISKMESQLNLIRGSINELKESTKLDEILPEDKFTNVNVDTFGSDVITPLSDYINELSGTLSKIKTSKEEFDSAYNEIKDIIEPFEDDQKEKKSQIVKSYLKGRYILFISSLIKFKGQMDKSIIQLDQGIKGLDDLIKTKGETDQSESQTNVESKGGSVREAIEKITRELPTLKDINQDITSLKGLKSNLQKLRNPETIDKIATGEDEFTKALQTVTSSIQGLNSKSHSGAKEAIKDISVKTQPQSNTQGGTVQPTETCPQSQESRSAGDNGSLSTQAPTGDRTGEPTSKVGQELEDVDKELHKLELYRDIIATLKGIDGKLVQHKIDTYNEKSSQAIDTCISELKGLEQKITKAESLTTGVGATTTESKGTGTTSVGGVPTGTTEKPLSETLEANETKKSLLRKDRSKVISYRDELDEHTTELGPIKDRAEKKSALIQALESPMNTIQSSVTAVNNTKSSIQDLDKLRDNMHKVKSERDSMDNHRDKVEKLQSLKLTEYTTDVTTFLRTVSETLKEIEGYLQQVKKNVNGTDTDTITIQTEKTKVDSEIESITQTKGKLDKNDKSIQDQSKVYLGNFDNFNKSIEAVEKAIESVVTDFIRCSLHSLRDSLRNIVLQGYDYHKVGEILKIVFESTSDLQDLPSYLSMSQLNNKYSQLEVSLENIKHRQ